MKTNTTKFIWFAFLSTLIGFGFFVYLTIHHYDLHFGQGGGTALCNVSSAINCDSISASQFSEVFGIPVAVLGLLAHLSLLGLLLGLALNWFDDMERASRMSFYLGFANLIASLVMGFISFAILGTICLFCTGTYLTAILIFVFLWLGLPEKGFSFLFRDIGETLTTHKTYLIPTLGILALSWLVDTSMEKRYGANDLQIRVVELYSRMMASPVTTFDEKNGILKGSENKEPRIRIVEFIDYRCPHCKVASNNLESFISTRDDIQLTIKSFPLDSTCNPLLQQGDGISCHLAFLAHCSNKIANKGWDAAKFIFKNQDSFRSTNNKTQLTSEIAGHVGVDIPAMEECLKDNQTFEAIQSQAQEGKSISGTPAIFIDGRLLPGAPALPVLQKLYEKIKLESGK